MITRARLSMNISHCYSPSIAHSIKNVYAKILKFVPCIFLGLVLWGCSQSPSSGAVNSGTVNAETCTKKDQLRKDIYACNTLSIAKLSNPARMMVAQRARQRGDYALASDATFFMVLDESDSVALNHAMSDALAASDFNRADILASMFSSEHDNEHETAYDYSQASPSQQEALYNEQNIYRIYRFHQLFRALINAEAPVPQNTTENFSAIEAIFWDSLTAAAYAKKQDIQKARDIINNPQHSPQPNVPLLLTKIHRDLLNYVDVMLTVASLDSDISIEDQEALLEKVEELKRSEIPIRYVLLAHSLILTKGKQFVQARALWQDVLEQSTQQATPELIALWFIQQFDNHEWSNYALWQHESRESIINSIGTNILNIASIIMRDIDAESSLILANVAQETTQGDKNSDYYWLALTAQAEAHLAFNRREVAIDILSESLSNRARTKWSQLAAKIMYANLAYTTKNTKLSPAVRKDTKTIARNNEKVIALLTELASQRVAMIPALNTLGYFARNDGRWEEARSHYNEILNAINDKNLSSWYILFYRGVSYERLGLWANAELDFKEALELSPNNPQVLNYLAYSWVERSINVNQSLEMLTKALEQIPNDGAIVDSLGWAYYRLGNYPKALELLERSATLIPNNSEVSEHLGDTYWRLGRYRESRFQWRNGIETADNAIDRNRLIDKHINGLPADKKLITLK